MTYHYILKDCEKHIANDMFNKDTRIFITLELKNSGL